MRLAEDRVMKNSRTIKHQNCVRKELDTKQKASEVLFFPRCCFTEVYIYQPSNQLINQSILD